MNTFKNWLNSLFLRFTFFDPESDPKQLFIGVLVVTAWFFVTLAIIFAFRSHNVLAAGGGTVSLPTGSGDASSQLEAAGILLKILDTGIFKWGARLFAGLCIMSAAWALKEQRFGVAVICIVGAILFGTAPKWVANLFDIGGNQGIFAPGTSSYYVPHESINKIEKMVV